MLLNNLVITVAVILQSFAVHPAMFIIGRFICGINSGTHKSVYNNNSYDHGKVISAPALP